jgi:hypothetical protein
MRNESHSLEDPFSQCCTDGEQGRSHNPSPAGPRLINTSALLSGVQMVLCRDGLWRRRIRVPVSQSVTVTAAVVVRFVQVVDSVVRTIREGQ